LQCAAARDRDLHKTRLRKYLLAQRLAGLLPPLTALKAQEAAAMASLAGPFDAGTRGLRQIATPRHTPAPRR